jgi:hypothetical protein
MGPALKARAGRATIRNAERAVDRLTSFEQFWPYYVAQHSKKSTRALHLAGTTLVLVTLAGSAVMLAPRWALLAPVVGYAPAWVGHFFFERNRPATFRYPWWSLRGDFRMYALTLAGRMGPEIERAARAYPGGA